MVEFTIEEISYTLFLQWVEMFSEFGDLIENIGDRLPGKASQITTRLDKVETDIRSQLITFFQKPSSVGLNILAELYTFENFKDSDPALEFLEDTSDDSDDDDEDEDDVDTEDDSEGDENDISEDEEKPEIFDTNTIIFCEQERLVSDSCRRIDVTVSH